MIEEFERDRPGAVWVDGEGYVPLTDVWDRVARELQDPEAWIQARILDCYL